MMDELKFMCEGRELNFTDSVKAVMNGKYVSLEIRDSKLPKTDTSEMDILKPITNEVPMKGDYVLVDIFGGVKGVLLQYNFIGDDTYYTVKVIEGKYKNIILNVSEDILHKYKQLNLKYGYYVVYHETDKTVFNIGTVTHFSEGMKVLNLVTNVGMVSINISNIERVLPYKQGDLVCLKQNDVVKVARVLKLNLTTNNKVTFELKYIESKPNEGIVTMTEKEFNRYLDKNSIVVMNDIY